MKTYIIMLILLSLLGCTSETKVIEEKPSEISIEKPEWGKEVSEDYLNRVKANAKGINKLTNTLLGELEEDKGVISGFSAYSALSTVNEWTSGETKVEIEKGVGKIDAEALEHSKMVFPIETGTLFLIDDETKLNTKETNRFVFEDLQADSIINKVNNYVAKQTHDVINRVLNKPFSASTRAAIIDTLYFKGTWQDEFDKALTKKDTFYGKDKETEIEFMHNTARYGVNTEDKRVKLNYKEGNIVMDLMYDITDKDKAFEKYIEDIEKNNLDYKYDSFVELSMPKFEIETTKEISGVYKNLGINKLFTSEADLTKLGDNLRVDSILQKAKIIVDEKGTEAAAVTVVAVNDACAIVEDLNFIKIDINKPFMYAIRDSKTNTILFAGFINNF